jgi:hypothetical protein
LHKVNDIMNMVPKFKKVELLIKDILNNVELPSVTKIEFNNCGLMITGDYIVVTVEDSKLNDDNYTKEITNIGRIFHLSEVSAYKTYN